MMVLNPEAYEVLGIAPSDSYEHARKRYRHLVKLHHPDRGGDPSDFLKVKAAWDTVNARGNGLGLVDLDGICVKHGSLFTVRF